MTNYLMYHVIKPFFENEMYIFSYNLICLYRFYIFNVKPVFKCPHMYMKLHLCR